MAWRGDNMTTGLEFFSLSLFSLYEKVLLGSFIAATLMLTAAVSRRT